MPDEFPPSPQWVWYATRELQLLIDGNALTCPHCRVTSRNISLNEEGAIPRFHCGECQSGFSAEDYHAAQRFGPSTGVTTLYRPIGELELDKIRSTGFRRFPPRLVWQPIFYPVLTEDYADFIAREWNSTDPDHNYVGFVTRFDVRNAFLSQYEIHTASDRQTREYWIPAEELDAFNDNIVGEIEVIGEFRRGQRIGGTA